MSAPGRRPDAAAADHAAHPRGAATTPDLARRCVALAVGGRVTPERLARAVGRQLDGPAPVTAEAVLAALERAAPRRPPAAALEAAEARLHHHGAVVLVAGGPSYPERLAWAWPELGAPLWLFAIAPGGRLPRGPAVAVVGTRHPTVDGLETARALGRLLGRQRVTVVSGMARGIDQAAHRGALDAGGATVAVLGCGFDVDYPRGDGALRAEVAAAGGVVTELPPDARPEPRHFLARNRLISGLADVTVVVEGRRRSGALQTARLAASQGREVWAVPGSLNAPTSRGPLDLVRDGARLVTRLEDVLEAVTDFTGAPEPAPGGRTGAPAGGHGLGPAAARVLPLLGPVPAGVARLAASAGLELPEVLAAVAELADRGLARSTPRGVVRVPCGDCG